MKISILVGVAAATVGLAAPLEANGTEKHDLQARSFIPVSEVKCTGYNLDVRDVEVAKFKMMRWDLHGNKVWERGFHSEWYGSTCWYICNCKNTWRDGTPIKELDEAQRLIVEKCGEGHSGYVWSQPWNKGYNIASSEAVGKAKVKEICPYGCLWLWFPGPTLQSGD